MFEENNRCRAMKAMQYSDLEPNERDGTNFVGLINLIYGLTIKT